MVITNALTRFLVAFVLVAACLGGLVLADQVYWALAVFARPTDYAQYLLPAIIVVLSFLTGWAGLLIGANKAL